MHTDIDIQALMELVRQAGKLLYDREGSTHIRKKGRADYVTQVDMAVQGFFSEELPKRWPHIQFMSEEQSNAHLDPNAPMWILDPVDGTCNLIHDLGMSAISLALVEGGQVMLGIVYNPFNGEMFHAIRGQGAFRNGEPIHVSDQQELADSLIAIGTSPYQKQLAETNFALFRRLFEVGADIRRMGTASLDLAYVACGRMDAYLERGLKPWDFAAGLLLVEEAGGQVQDYQGKPLVPTQPSDMFAHNGPIGARIAEAVSLEF